MTDTPLHSVSVAGVTFDECGRVLLIRRRDNGAWQAPGGVLELGETFEQGVRREVLEETGVEVGVDRLTGVYKNLKKGVISLVYRCRYLSGSPTATDEAAEAAWLPVQHALKLMVPAFAVRITDAERSRTDVPSREHDGIDLI